MQYSLSSYADFDELLLGSYQVTDFPIRLGPSDIALNLIKDDGSEAAVLCFSNVFEFSIVRQPDNDDDCEPIYNYSVKKITKATNTSSSETLLHVTIFSTFTMKILCKKVTFKRDRHDLLSVTGSEA